MNQHVASVHLDYKPFKCKICDYSCLQKGNMNQHVASVHLEYKPFKCERCNYSSSHKGTLNRHFSSVHEENKPFKCDICEATLRKSRLKTHMIKIHGGKIS